MGYEKNGRPVLYTRACNWEMHKTTADMHMHACLFYSDLCMSSMPPHIDNYVMIFDFEDFSLSQMNAMTVKKLISVLTEIFPGTCNKYIMVRVNWTARSLWYVVKPFLTER